MSESWRRRGPFQDIWLGPLQRVDQLIKNGAHHLIGQLGDDPDALPTAQGARAWSQATVGALLTREGVH